MRHFIYITTILFALSTLNACGTKSNSFEEFNDPSIIGYSQNQLTSRYNLIGGCETGLGDVVADAMLYSVKIADLAFINAGSVRRRDISSDMDTWIGSGPVSVNDLVLIFPFDNPTARSPSNISTLMLSGSTLKKVFENAFSRMSENGTITTSFGRFLQVSGVQVYANVALPIGSRITGIRLLENNETIDMNSSENRYSVAVPTKYIKDTPGFRDYDDYWDILAQGDQVIDTGVRLFDATLDYVTTFSPLAAYHDIDDCSSDENRLVIKHL